MLIRNVKSYSDLERKKNLQAQILQVQIDNESMLESRVKDYQNPNKPPPVPPQYKTNSELALDTNFQQKEVIDNLLTISGVNNFLALSVSQGLSQLPNGVGNFLIFNKNFPIIRKRLEDISKRSYDTDTFMAKIEEVLQQIELGIFYQSTGGQDASVAFNMGMGGALVMPSGQALPVVASTSSYGSLLLELYAIRDTPQSPLTTDPTFVNMLAIIERLCEASPLTEFLNDFDLIEYYERQRLQRSISVLFSTYNLPKFIDIENFSNTIVVADYQASVAQALQAGAQIQLSAPFEKAYAKLVNKINGIKQPIGTSINELIKVKDKITNLLGGQRAVRTGLQGQVQQAQLAQQQAQQALIQAQALQAQQAIQARNAVIQANSQNMDNRLANPAMARQRILQTVPNPYTNVNYYPIQFFDYGASISGNDPSQNPADQIIEMREVVSSEVLKADGKTRKENYTLEELPQNFQLLDRYQAGKVAVGGARAGIPTFANYPLIKGDSTPLTPQEVAVFEARKGQFLKKYVLTGKNKTVGNQILELRERYNEAELANIVRNQEIDPLKLVLQNDANYDPQNKQQQQAIGMQGFGFRTPLKFHSGSGFKDVMKERSDVTNRAIAEPFVNAGNKIKGFFGGEIMCPAVYEPVMKNGKMYSNSCEASAYGNGLMCPQNHNPVMAKDGKMYGNRCKAQAGGGADPNYKVDGMGFMNRKIKIGAGIAVQEQPRYKTFGKYIIHMPYLENDNVLNVKFQSMGSIPSIKPVSIDDNFKDFVLDIMNTGGVNQKHYNSLTEPEKTYFHKIVKGAGLSNTLKFKQDDKIDDKKDVKRLDILVGQITAGNDNDKVLKEAKELIKKCVGNGSITKYRGMDLLLQIE